MRLGFGTSEAAGFLGMSAKTLRVVYDHRIRFPVHTTSLIFGVTSICIVDDTGRIVREVKVEIEPEALPPATRLGAALLL
jgi:hypothetical protein